MLASSAALVLANFLGKNTPFAPGPAPFLVLGFAGFALGVVGHIFRSRLLVTTGIAMVFGAIVAVPLVLYLSGRQ
jgi:hypothetical protein